MTRHPTTEQNPQANQAHSASFCQTLVVSTNSANAKHWLSLQTLPLPNTGCLYKLYQCQTLVFSTNSANAKHWLSLQTLPMPSTGCINKFYQCQSLVVSTNSTNAKHWLSQQTIPMPNTGCLNKFYRTTLYHRNDSGCSKESRFLPENN